MERWLAYFANKLNQKEREGLAMLNPEIAEATDASECPRRPIQWRKRSEQRLGAFVFVNGCLHRNSNKFIYLYVCLCYNETQKESDSSWQRQQ